MGGLNTGESMTGQADLERKALRISILGYFLLGILAVIFALKSQSEAIMLDGFFNFVSFVMSLVTLHVSNLLRISYDRRFQYGFMPFEPFVNVVKGLIILVVCGFALVSSIDSLIDGGRALSPGVAVIYSMIATTGCIVVFLIQKQYAKKVDSPLLALDIATWKLSGFISSAVAVGFGAAYLLSRTEYSWIVPYIDPVMVIILILVMIRLPLSALKEGIGDLLLGAPPGEMQSQIKEKVSTALSEFPVERHSVRMVKVGRHIFVSVFILLSAERQTLTVEDLDRIRQRIDRGLKELHPVIIADTLFSGDGERVPESPREDSRDG
jgi:cation diffusion facilitator family transporter